MDVLGNCLSQCSCEDVVQLYPTEPDTQAGSTCRHQSDVSQRDGPPAVVTPVGPAPRNCRGEGDVGLFWGAGGQFDRGEMGRLGRVGEPAYGWLPTQRMKGDECVMQRRTATDQQVAPVRIGVDQVQ